MLAKNAVEVVTCVHTSHHQKIKQFWSTYSENRYSQTY